MKEYFVGLMSGTSLDGIDAALVDLNNTPQLVNSYYLPYNPELKAQLQQLCHAETVDLDALGQLDAQLGELYASAVLRLLEQAEVSAYSVTAIGCHGQTIRHLPNAPSPFTWQLGDANRIRQRTGITTVTDFRRADIAQGGQGAPLTPTFHAAFLNDNQQIRIILNIGGMANITRLAAGHPVIGFDTGPGNVLLDGWVQRHQDEPYDRAGHWGQMGQCHAELLARLLADPYFALPIPKSTGREYFNLAWLDRHLADYPTVSAVDVQATLYEFTAQSIAYAIKHSSDSGEVVICGGGVHNTWLLQRLRQHLPHHPCVSSEQLGLDPDWVESMAFAWFAQQTLAQRPGNLPDVTGARRPVVLGAVYF